MNDMTHPLPSDHPHENGRHSDPACPHPSDEARKSKVSPRDAGRVLLAGLVGGVATAVGYAVYSNLPEEQKERLHTQVRDLIESRLNELRSALNLDF
ncbi:MAG TPA: hypothetical protein VGZ00_10770 [Candidatus Baltobacteraceae bacterium]|jgi:hypothetical protein|nr:hypothetical protein [Candidatus Baltobacteraceae bacterium]